MIKTAFIKNSILNYLVANRATFCVFLVWWLTGVQNL